MDVVPVPEPSFEEKPPMRLAGVQKRYPFSDCSGIPDQWTAFRPRMAAIPNQVGDGSYGVCFAADEAQMLDYFAGVAVSGAAALPDGIISAEVPAQHYAIFRCDDHISRIQQIIMAIWQQWLPESGRIFDPGPTVEHYGPGYNPDSGEGGFEIWIPVKP